MDKAFVYHQDRADSPRKSDKACGVCQTDIFVERDSWCKTHNPGQSAHDVPGGTER